MKKIIFGLILGIVSFPISSEATSPKIQTFQAEIWVDNWFALYVNGKKVGEDSVPITTEKSFNSEKIKFTASYPFTVGLYVRDFTENSSGLEYIGKSNQQIGDGGAIAQFRDLTTKKIIATTDSSWKALVINRAPLNPECEKSSNPTADCKYQNSAIPKNWTLNSFKSTSWPAASEYSKEVVGVKEGFFDFAWSDAARLIWSSNLKLDNSILLRKTLTSTSATKIAATQNLKLQGLNFVDGGKLPVDYTCDGAGVSPGLKWEGAPVGTKSFAITFDTLPGPARPGEVVDGKHAMFTLFNIPATVTSLPVGNKNIGIYGQNFQGKSLGYAPPCSQGPGDKTYTFTIYALSTQLSLQASVATESAIEAAVAGKILATAKLVVTFARQ